MSDTRIETAAMILFLAVFADVCLRLSAPETIGIAGLLAFLSLLVSLAILFIRTTDWSAGGVPSNLPAHLPAALAVGLYGLHPSTIGALRGASDGSLVAALSGIAAGIAICRWEPPRPRHRWAALIPVVPCILLHRAGAGFAPLLAASLWLSGRRNILDYWPSLIVSLVAGFLHRADGFHPAASVAAIPAIFAGFVAPFAASLSAGWTAADGLAAFTAIAGMVVAATIVFRMPGVAFGLIWFLVLALLAPSEPLAAFPGLALAAIAALAPVSARLPEALPS